MLAAGLLRAKLVRPSGGALVETVYLAGDELAC